MTRTTWFKSLAITAVVAALAACGSARADFVDVYTAGHADVNVSYDNGSLHLNYDFGSNAVINGVTLGAAGAGDREADTITVFVNPTNSTGVGAAGLPSPFAGNPLYTIPQVSTAGRPFLGLGAETIDQGIFANETITYTLTGFSSSTAGGQFILWQNGNESTPYFNTSNGLSSADSVGIGTGGHDHYNYGFTAQGTYDVTITASGILASTGQRVATSAIYRFQVGAAAAVPEPGSLVMAGVGMGSLGLLVARRKAKRTSPEAAE